jgi:hypothetical protein
LVDIAAGGKVISRVVVLVRTRLPWSLGNDQQELKRHGRLVDRDRRAGAGLPEAPRGDGAAEIASRIGLSEGAVHSVVTLLAQEGKLRISRVGLFDPPSRA